MGEKKLCDGLDILIGWGSEEFVKKVYVSESVGPSSRGRPPGRRRDRVKEYICDQ